MSTIRKRIASVVPAGLVKKAAKVRLDDDNVVDHFLDQVRHTSEHHSVRRLSQAQQDFLKIVLHGRSPKDEAKYIIENEFTYTYLLGKLLVIAVLGIVLIGLSAKGVASANVADLSNTAAITFLFCGVMVVIASSFGIYGALRVKQDILLDDDGLETVGQHLLQIYFHMALAYNMVVFPTSFAVVSDPDSFLSASLYGDAEMYVNLSAWISLVVSIVIFLSLYTTVKIVTVFEMAQSFLETFSTLLVVIAVFGLVVSFDLIHFGQFFGDIGGGVDIIVYSFMVLCILIVLNSMLGFGAALIENGYLLRLHAVGSAIVLLGLLSIFIALATVNFTSLINDNCSSIMHLMSAEWWQNVVTCPKYQGQGNQVEDYDTKLQAYVYTTTGVGLSARCTSASQLAFAWEYVEASKAIAANSSFLSANEANYFEGCLQLGCCQILAINLKQHSTVLLVGIFLLVIAMGWSITADLWMSNRVRNQTDRIKNITNKRARVLMGILSFVVLVAAVLVSQYIGDAANKAIPSEIVRKLNLDSSISDIYGTLNNVSRVRDCQNSILDGFETDVDCGGECTNKCDDKYSCRENADCKSGYCDEMRCRIATYAELSTNGVRDSFETDVDCGGGYLEYLISMINENATLESSMPAFLCGNGKRCEMDNDCQSQFCSSNVCVSCQDGMMNGDEPDVDCGSIQCREYYRSYNGSSPSDLTLLTNADEAGNCLDGRNCIHPSDCSSGICHNKLCVSTNNGIKDGDETDVDCGGYITRKRCGIDQDCCKDSDCVGTTTCTGSHSSGQCIPGVCTAVQNPSNSSSEDPWAAQGGFQNMYDECHNNAWDDSHEVDVDCGGSFCPGVGQVCADGLRCEADTDCESNHCQESICVSCTNGIVDGSETDIDCGGDACRKYHKCSRYQGCKIDADCSEDFFCLSTELYQVTTNFTQGREFELLLDTCQLKLSFVVISQRQSARNTAQSANKVQLYMMPVVPQQQAVSSVRSYDDPDDSARRLADNEVDVNAVVSHRQLNHLPLYHSVNRRLAQEFADDDYFFMMFDVCNISSVYTTEYGTSIIVLNDEGVYDYHMSTERTLVVRGIKQPQITVGVDTCHSGLGNGISVSVVFSLRYWFCPVLFGTPEPSIETFFLRGSTVIQGRVITATGGIEAAQVRVWAVKEQSCMGSSCDGECSGKSFNECSGCCTWSDSESDLFMNTCIGTSAINTPSKTLSLVDGSFTLSIPEFEDFTNTSSWYYLEYRIEKDGFQVNSGSRLRIHPGSVTDLGVIQLVARPLPACGCDSYESASLADESALCREPITRSCFPLSATGSCVGYCQSIHSSFSNTLCQESSCDSLLMANNSCEEILMYSMCDNTITPEPTSAPTISPTRNPSRQPTSSPSKNPSVSPSSSPSKNPSVSPSASPSTSPSMSPSASPSTSPSASPSTSPSQSPSMAPTRLPTGNPTTKHPSHAPTASPSVAPSMDPTANPTVNPTSSPTIPTEAPTKAPTGDPTVSPTAPTEAPSTAPTTSPSSNPTSSPSASPSSSPSASPSDSPSSSPSASPSSSPSASPSSSPSASPSSSPSSSPSASPSTSPSSSPSSSPSVSPSSSPSSSPSDSPSSSPSSSPSASPSSSPSSSPSDSPSSSPSSSPSASPSSSPSSSPSASPSKSPTVPTDTPTSHPSANPTSSPTAPTTNPTRSPSFNPTTKPTTASPTTHPSKSPTTLIQFCRATTDAIIQLDGAEYNDDSLVWMDQTGNENHAVLDAAVQYDALSQSFRFDGGGLAQVQGIDLNDLLKLGSLTIELWFRMDVQNDAARRWIVGGSDSYSYDRSVFADDSRFGGVGQGLGHLHSARLGVPSACRWHHLVAVFSQDDVSFVALDGDLGVSTFGYNRGSMLEVKPFTIGGLRDESSQISNALYGDVRMVKMFNRAFTAEQVAESYDRFLQCNDVSDTCSPTSMPTSSPQNLLESFADLKFDMGHPDSLSSIVRIHDDILNYLQLQYNPDFQDGASNAVIFSKFGVSWTESFTIHGATPYDCDEVTMREQVARARCGPYLTSSCTTSDFVVSGGDILVTMRISVDDLIDARILDREQTFSSPFSINYVSKFPVNLKSGTCVTNDVTVSTFSVQGYAEIEASVTLHGNNIHPLYNKWIYNMLKRLDAVLNEATSLSHTLSSIERCPVDHLCSSNGLCCMGDACLNHTLGTCICETNYTGYQCDEDAEVAVESVSALTCVVRFPGTGEDICSQPGACENSFYYGTICEYEGDSMSDADACENGGWVKVFSQEGCSPTLDIGPSAVNYFFGLRKMWKYEINDELYAFYKFNGQDLPQGYSAYRMMLSQFSSLKGTHLINSEFQIFNRVADLVSGTNPWYFCTYDEKVGFPGDARPSIEGSSDFVGQYTNNWASGHCDVAGAKTPHVESFSFSLCVPSGVSFDFNSMSPVNPQPKYRISGTIIDAQSLVGVRATVMLFKGAIDEASWEMMTPIHSVDVVLTEGGFSLEQHLTGCTGPESTLDIFESAKYFNQSIFEFPTTVAVGTYSLVVFYRARGDAEQVFANESDFNTKLVVLSITDRDMDILIQVTRKVPEGSALVLFEAGSVDLDLVVKFDMGDAGSCTVSSKLLSDNSCQCSGTSILRRDTSLFNGVATQLLYIENMRKTNYVFYISYNKPIATSTFKRYRDDGRCGHLYPLASGEISECPPVPVLWGDGTTDLRPCCQWRSGYCGSTEAFCLTRYSTDYRTLYDEEKKWVTQTRADLKCNIPTLLTDDDKWAYCPEDQPCCGPNGRCGVTSYHCLSDISIDYSRFYNLSITQSTDQQLISVEESNAKISIYSFNTSVPNVVVLPDASVKANYYDGYAYVTGSKPSLSSSYMRAFCIGAKDDGSASLAEYPAPRFFEWKGQMFGLSANCPAKNKCQYLHVSGLTLLSVRATLSGTYIRRFTESDGYDANPGHRISTSTLCRTNVFNPDNSNYQWRHLNVLGGAEACLLRCDSTNECQASVFIEYMNGNQELVNWCSFHHSVDLCGGIDDTNDLRYTAYEKRTSKSLIWYSKLDSLYSNTPIHLYRGEDSWFVDDDLVESNGYLARALTTETTETPPVVRWIHYFDKQGSMPNFETVTIVQVDDDCMLGGNFPTLVRTIESKGCSCPGTNCKSVLSSCSSFPLRISESDYCLEAVPTGFGLYANKCNVLKENQRFFFNKNKNQLEANVTNQHNIIKVYQDVYLVSTNEGSNSVFEASAPLGFTEEGYICKFANSTLPEQTGYDHQVTENRICLTAFPFPGSIATFAGAASRSLWATFQVI